MQNYRRTSCIFRATLVLLLILAPLIEGQNATLKILYTGNLNAALDDCRCGGDLVGGLTRIATEIEKYRRKYPNLLLLDAGDYLNSYPDPSLNLLFLKFLQKMNYTALNLGDQEFVEGPEFLAQYFSTHPNPPKMISSNIHPARVKPFFAAKIAAKSANDARVLIWGFTSPRAFDFIPPRHLRFTSVDKFLVGLPESVRRSPDLKIVLFHGKWSAAEVMAKKFSFLNIIIIAHNQHRRAEIVGRTLLAEPGMEGEYLGLITAVRENRNWKLENKFIPIRKTVPENPAFQKRVQRFYKTTRNQKITSKRQSQSP